MRAGPAIAGLAALFVSAATPLAAQDVTKPRGSGRGCIHTEGPPGSSVARSAQRPVALAWFAGRSTAYDHGVLGDSVEATALYVGIVPPGEGKAAFCDSVSAGPDRVFEDISPRLADLDGDGRNEVIVVASHARYGARLEIYGYPAPGRDFTLLAHTPYIGQAHRWLAPVGAADLNGDGTMEIAYIDRPHLAKTLRIWRYDEGALVPVAEQAGFTNHKIGWDFIPGGIRECGSRAEMIVASGDWSRVMGVGLTQGRVIARDLGPYTGPDSMSAAQSCR